MHERGEIARATRLLTWTSVTVLGVLSRTHPRAARASTTALIGSIGIAHGATDVDILDRLGVRPPGGRVALSIAYGLFAAATFALARRAPRLAGRSLFGLSVWHFGSGDVAFARACGADADGIAEAVLRGIVPLTIAGTTRSSTISAAIAVARALAKMREGDLCDALDLAIPASMLLATEPRFGFAIYFGAWHSIRHTALVLERDPRAGDLRARGLRFAREAAPNVVIAVVAGALAAALDRRSPAPATTAARASEDEDRRALFGALILAITVPHQIAVTIFERRARA